jgi:hypothetical protein
MIAPDVQDNEKRVNPQVNAISLAFWPRGDIL